MVNERPENGAPGNPWSRSSNAAHTTEPLDYDDPAYASQAYQYPALTGSYQPHYSTTAPSSQYGGYASGPVQEQPEPPHRSNTFWLWVIGAGAGVVIVALVIALIYTTRSDDRRPAVIATPAPTRTVPTQTPAMPTLPSMPTMPRFTLPPIPANPTPGNGIPQQPATESVVYDVKGTGTALTVMYFDGTALQTEFNVSLPWHREVTMSKDQLTAATVIVTEFKHDVTCSLSVNGTQRGTSSGVFAICNSYSN